MGTALVVGGKKSCDALVAMVRESGYREITPAFSGGEARRVFAEKEFELVLINTPLSDEFGADLALRAARTAVTGVMLFVRGEQAAEVSAQVEEYGVFVVEKPLSRQIFHQAVRLVEAARRQMLVLERENVRLQAKMEETRLICRAKCILIESLGMTEELAHRHIEKQAMDLRMTRREIAQSILERYESNERLGRDGAAI